ncbi:MAG: transketolase [Planctomycetota bacterium]|nr:MAG: transketolase [Planctomycetota bacterium]REJ87189.1 MAG: transketolase [Planctomycetota bacterium]REK23847.1 MAG: transketolase [Planctomycetota bacterium]REK44723.1 MAG: transketolase [Planctomycetota bacterium]
MSTTTTSIEQLTINTIRTLSMDGVQAANSGHPGTPMALAPVTYALWSEVLRYDPAAPQWPARDRFVLSCGHASMLLYSVLHLAGVAAVDERGATLGRPAISLDDLKNFRQLESPCAGHPEFGEAAGIETTTGPLGQGVGNSVGLAMAGRWLAATYDRPGFELFGFNVYALASDGDLMEGVASEAASLAGHLQLANLCWIYDDNKITIEGETELAFSEDVATRFTGLGWHVVRVDDANDLEALKKAYDAFVACDDRPTLIIVRSHIGYGSPNKQDTHGAHGAPLGEDEVRLTKEAYGWPADEKFLVPEEVRMHFGEAVAARGAAARSAWEAKFADYAKQHPELAAQVQTLLAGELPDDWDADLPSFEPDAKGAATRITSGQVLNALAGRIGWLLGGSGDLAPSTMTLLKEESSHAAGHAAGRNLHFGIREHGMAASANGLALARLRPYVATFFVFTDYLRPSMRLAAMMRLPVLYVLTHDSIGLGEDGPTHQPIEHLAAVRAIPRLITMRPGDANEVTEAYRAVLPIGDRPTAMVLTRQALPTLDRSRYASAAGVARGGYVLADAADGAPEVILIGTGSELAIAVEAYEQLAADGVKVRLVSLPSWELFDEQEAAYHDEVLPPSVTARVAVEAGIAQGWERYLGPLSARKGEGGRFLGLSDFGASAPYQQLYEHFGLTPAAVVAAARDALGR